VRNRIKEVTTKEYMGVREGTLDYVILFIPNEQVFSFILEKDQSVLDDALKMKVVLCAPISLYAILSIIRQAMNNFRLEKNLAQAFVLISEFHVQWEKFIQEMSVCGKKIEGAQESFQKLCVARKTALEGAIKRIDELSQISPPTSSAKADETIVSGEIEKLPKMNMTN
jgi:DNA recombination protein RmuC